MDELMNNYFSMLDEELELVIRIQKFTMEQYGLIEEEKYDKLVENLDARAVFMKRVEDITLELNKYDASQLNSNRQGEIDEKKIAIDKIVQDIRQHNVKLKTMVEQHKEQYREEIKELRGTQKGVQGYGQMYSPYGGTNFDQKS